MIVISCFLPGKTYSAQEATWAFRDGSQSVRTARCRSRGLPCFRIMSTSVNVNSIKFMIFHANVANISVKLSQWASPFIYIIAFDVWMICVLAGVEECHNALRQELGIVRQEARGPIQRSNFNTFNIFIYFLHSWFFSEAPIFFQVSLQSLLYTLYSTFFPPVFYAVFFALFSTQLSMFVSQFCKSSPHSSPNNLQTPLRTLLPILLHVIHSADHWAAERLQSLMLVRFHPDVIQCGRQNRVDIVIHYLYLIVVLATWEWL